VPAGIHQIRLTVDVRLDEPGVHRLAVGTVGGHRIVIDGQVAAEDWRIAGVEVVLDSTINNPDATEVEVSIDSPRTVRVESTHLVTHAGGYGSFVRALYRHRVPSGTTEEEIAAAVALAKESDLVVVVVGTNEEVESEGWDRTSLRLPGRQDELVEAVLDVNPHAVIIVNAGAPVILPWLDRAGTVLWCWFPGQEAGTSLAAVVAGDLEPAGRLPWTLPANEADVPVPHALPDAEGVIHYSDGVHVGYRGWERDGLTPARPFGFGLGWTDWRYESLSTPRWTSSGDLELDVTVTNTGTRDGRETVQAYLSAPPADAGAPDRPVRWLGGFAAADVAAGHTRQVTVVIPRRRFETWDSTEGRWTQPAGTVTVSVGRSVRELLLDTAVQSAPPESSEES
jgi:beta-glucosidase